MEKNKKLNKEQLAAIRYGEGPLLIIAGAGTGKTTVITERIKHLISSGAADPAEILALTFTEKAASEMEERIDRVMPYGYTSMWISTFHAFCDRVLRDDGLAIGLPSDFKLLTEATATAFVRKNLFEFELDYFRPLGNPDKFIGGMLTHFSRLADEDINPSDYISWVNSKSEILNSKHSESEELENIRYQELAKAYRKYDELKIANSYLDFSDLISKTLFLYRKRPNVLKEYQKKFKYILIDEFQDTNYAQNELAVILSGKQANLTVCGDDDQSIYRFRGAAVSNIMQFREIYPKAAVVVLTQNYRSTKQILDASYNLINFNNPDRLEVTEKINKKLISANKKSGKEPFFIHEEDSNGEAERVAEEIIKLTKKDYSYSDIAILVRANNHADAFIKALERINVPSQFLGPNKLYERSEIIDLISYLRVLYDLNDSASLMRVLLMDEFEIDARDLAILGARAKKYNESLVEVLAKSKDLEIRGDSQEKIEKILKLIDRQLREKKEKGPGQILYDFLREMELMKKLINPETAEQQLKAENITLLFEKVKQFEGNAKEATVEEFVDLVNLAIEMGESPRGVEADWTAIEAVNIMTIHGAKGLEFPVVFLPNLVDLRFPQMNRRDQIPIPEELIKEALPQGDYHLQEERRIFYVGMTRAKERLYLSAADYYNLEGRKKKLSPFVFEALGDNVASAERKDEKQLLILEKIKKEKATKPIRNHEVHYLSYSQIESFKICPLHYKLQYILKVPTIPSPALSFGSSIHNALNNFYEEVRQGEKASIKLLINKLDEVWMREGYMSRKHELEMKEKGKDILERFYKEEFEVKNLPIALEQPFIVPLRQGEAYIKIGGKIDRVDDLGGGKIEIIDYKTGINVPTQKQVDSNEQLSIYALAASKIVTAPFDKKPEEIKLTLHYLEEGKKISTTRTGRDLINVEKEIFKIKREIETSDFSCSGHYFCQTGCEFSAFCKTSAEDGA